MDEQQDDLLDMPMATHAEVGVRFQALMRAKVEGRWEDLRNLCRTFDIEPGTDAYLLVRHFLSFIAQNVPVNILAAFLAASTDDIQFAATLASAAMAAMAQDGDPPECPGCGIPDLKGPWENAEGLYYECHHCDRHVQADEIGGN